MPGSITYAALTPADPTVLVNRGGTGLGAATLEGLNRVAAAVRDQRPDRLVFLAPPLGDNLPGIGLMANPQIEGSLASFGLPQVQASVASDWDVRHLLTGFCRDAGTPFYVIDRHYRYPLPRAVTMLLSLMRAAGLPEVPVTVLALGDQPLSNAFAFGYVLWQALHHAGGRSVVIGVGEFAPPAEGGPDLAAPLADGSWDGVIAALKTLPPTSWPSGAAALAVLAGCLGDKRCECRVISREVAPKAQWLVSDVRVLADPFEPMTVPTVRPERDVASLATLALEAIYCYVAKGETVQAAGKLLERFAGRRAGVFVTVYKQGKVRACLGTIAPFHEDLCEETIRNAVSAAAHEGGDGPIRPDELPHLTVTVSILQPPEFVRSLDELDETRYGVVLSTGDRHGLMLPAFPGVKSLDAQLAAARIKAGVAPHESVWLYRFQTEVYHSWEDQGDGEAALTWGEAE